MPRLGLAGEGESPYQKEQVLKANTAAIGIERKRGWRLMRGKKK